MYLESKMSLLLLIDTFGGVFMLMHLFISYLVVFMQSILIPNPELKEIMI